MRNLKRALSLTLASVMLLGMMVVGTSALSFKDSDQITNVTAASVMEGIELFQGDGNGNFLPNATVTRAQMAAIVGKMLYGTKLDDTQFKGTSKFTDVPANHYANGYINLVASLKLMNGTSATTFTPDRTLTTAESALLLCRALGYFQGGELTGNWAEDKLIAVSKATSLGLFNGLNLAIDAPLNRDNVAAMTFNAITRVVPVEYNSQFDTYYTAGRAWTTGVADLTEDDIGDKDSLYQYSLGYKNFKLTRTTASVTDEFNRPAETWKADIKSIVTAPKAVDLTYTTEVKMSDIYKDLGWSKNATAGNTVFTMDGAASEAGKAADGSTELSTLAVSKTVDTKIGGKGVLVQVFDTSDATDNKAEITLINTYAGKVTAVRSDNVTIAPLNAGKGGNYDTKDFKLDDIVLFNYSNKSGDTGVKNVVLAEQVTGELTGYNGTKSVTVAGQSYDVAKVASVTLTQAMTKKDVTLTMDKYGYVLAVESKSADDNYAVVLKYLDGNDFDDAKAELLFTDGTKETVNLTANVDRLAGSGDVQKGAIVSYTTNSDNKYTLTVLADPTTNATSGDLTTKGSSDLGKIVGSMTGNGKTIFVVATKSGDDTVYTVYNGIANVPKITATSNTTPVSFYQKTGNTATVVYIDATDSTKATAESSNKAVVFVLGNNDDARYDTEKGTYYVYDAIVNGEITKIETGTKISAFTMYSNMSTNSKGLVSLGGTTGITANVTGTEEAENGIVGLGGVGKMYNENCEVFLIDKDKKISTYSVENIRDDASDKVWYKVTDDEVTTIVIYEQELSTTQITGYTYKVQGETAVTVSGKTLSTGTEAIATIPNGQKGKTVELTSVTCDNGGKYSVSGTATVANDDADVAAANTITVTLTAENGTQSTVTFTFKAAAAAPHVHSYGSLSSVDDTNHSKTCTDGDCPNSDGQKVVTSAHTKTAYNQDAANKQHFVKCADNCGWVSSTPEACATDASSGTNCAKCGRDMSGD